MTRKPKYALAVAVWSPLFAIVVLLAPIKAIAATWDEQGVKALCASEWPSDFSMQDYCVTQNRVGFEGFIALSSGNVDAELVPSFSACESEWGIQWDMVEYCAMQQISGKLELPLLLRDLPPDVAELIESQCRSDWGSDFSMVAYCAEQNATGWRNLNN